MNDRDAVLAANLEFYRAFATSDLAAMDRVWARKTPVLCAHPGWVPLAGRSTVMASWHDILSNPESPKVMCHEDAAYLYGEIALVLCEEELPGGHLAATNIFIREDGAWRLMHHHASPILMRETPRAH